MLFIAGQLIYELVGDRLGSMVKNAFHTDYIANGIVRVEDGSKTEGTTSTSPKPEKFYQFTPGNNPNITIFEKNGIQKTYPLPIPPEETKTLQQTCDWLTEERILCQLKTGEYRDSLKVYNYIIDTKGGLTSSVTSDVLPHLWEFYSFEKGAPYFLLNNVDLKSVKLLSRHDLSIVKEIKLPEGAQLTGHNSSPLQSCRFWGQKNIVCDINTLPDRRYVQGQVYVYNLDDSSWTFRDDLWYTVDGVYSSQSPFLISNECLYGWNYFLDLSGYYECERKVFYLENEDGQKIIVLDIERKKGEHFPNHLVTLDGSKFNIAIEYDKESSNQGKIKAYYVIDPAKLFSNN